MIASSLFRPLALAAALTFATAGVAGAATYTSLDAASSTVTFDYSQMSVDMNGGFSEIKATELLFDPANPQAARVALEIALKGVDAGYAEANTELATPTWLDIASHPLATFTAKNVSASSACTRAARPSICFLKSTGTQHR